LIFQQSYEILIKCVCVTFATDCKQILQENPLTISALIFDLTRQAS